MKRLLISLAAALALAVTGVAVYAQVYPLNPYTGRPMPGPPSYNPYTGQGMPAAGPNQWTGAPPGPTVNPFTNKPLPGSGAVNPFTSNPWAAGGPGTAAPPGGWPVQKYPVQGKAGPGLEPLDGAVLGVMDRHGIPGAALAIAKDGRLVYAKGFGWADLEDAVAAGPLTLFGLASLSKPLTALAILLLIEQGQLGLDDRAFDLLKHIQPPPGARVDPRLAKITVRQLLNHSGGWDRAVSGDPTNWSPQIARALNVPLPITEEQFTSFMQTVPLDFDPGTEMHYSNVGYILLGQIVAKVSGQRYDEFVRQRVLAPAGVHRALLNEGKRLYLEGEARRYLAGTNVLLPPMDLPMVRAAGGWETTVVDMVRVLTALDGSRGKPLLKAETYRMMLAPPPLPLRPRKDGSYSGLGWPTVTPSPQGVSYLHDGQFHGMRSFMKHSAKGISWVLLFNVSMQPDQIDDRVIVGALAEVRRRVEGIPRYPDVDLFDQYKD
jgi:N-acyl-D-amino-acid deacylase